MLTVLGKVNKRIISKLVKPSEVKDNSWYFIDYANEEIKLGEKFDTMLEGNQKTLIPGMVNIKLKKVFDQLGNNLDFIPKGFQAIANFDFNDKVPSPMKSLPSYESWDYNKNPIFIAKHEDIQLSPQPDAFKKHIYYLFIDEFKKKSNVHASNVSTKTFITYLKIHYAINDVEIKKIFLDFKTLGLLTEKSNKELELITDIDDGKKDNVI